MRQHFAEGFVDLSRSGLTSESVVKLGLDHRKGLLKSVERLFSAPNREAIFQERFFKREGE